MSVDFIDNNQIVQNHDLQRFNSIGVQQVCNDSPSLRYHPHQGIFSPFFFFYFI